jgi:D-hexose-6-phosphate mutarotase
MWVWDECVSRRTVGVESEKDENEAIIALQTYFAVQTLNRVSIYLT